MKKIFLSGEGSDELGDWYHLLQHRSTPRAVGILEALLRKIGMTKVKIVEARIWKTIRKFRFNPPVRGEVRNVLGLVNEAEEVGAEVLIFVRDQDGDRDREDDINEGLRQARERYALRIVGGVAVQEIEAWLLALLGERKSQGHADAKTVLRDKHGIADRGAKVGVVEGADLGRVPEDAVSLHAWLKQARDVVEELSLRESGVFPRAPIDVE